MTGFPRRRAIQLGGTAAALALTGRTAADADDESEDDSDPNDEYTIGISVGVDRDDLTEMQAEIVERLEEGEIEENEAQEELEEGQLELFEAAIEEVESHLEETDHVTVVDAAPGSGLVLVDGEPAALIEALEIDEVLALVPEEQFEGADGES
ncbi:hypothetical protein [Natrarchaeobius chitinivorans]|uniref:Uncharacterized protein n=1 Tax=Natrarchaeobius chitinivorans TaxID=1679083 RepID=A0A3N6MQ02_NATCH|nr:hypothetical protein [Natrarchaeobius chitinivorans]RQG96636.1 hypothetical protein EA473_05885 [Natrarchaeobius chitinivorans]